MGGEGVWGNSGGVKDHGNAGSYKGFQRNTLGRFIGGSKSSGSNCPNVLFSAEAITESRKTQNKMDFFSFLHKHV